MMRLYIIEDTYTYPRASPAQLQRAFDAFELMVEQYAFATRQIGDLDAALDLRGRQLSFTGFVDCLDQQGPRSCMARARALVGQFAALYALEYDLEHATAGRRLHVRAANGSFAAVQELVFTIPAP